MTDLFLTILLIGAIIIVVLGYFTYLGWQIDKDAKLRFNVRERFIQPWSVRIIVFVISLQIIASLIWLILLIHS